MKCFSRFLLLVVLMLTSQPVFSQEVAAALEPDTSRIRIGESLTLRLQLSHPKGLEIAWPAWIDSLAGMEVLRISEIDTPATNENSVLLRSQTVVVTSFDSGRLQFPPIRFNYTKADGRNISFETDPFLVEVLTVRVDTTRAFRDIKGNVSVPLDYRMIALWIACILVLAGALFWLYKRFRKKSVSSQPVDPQVIVPPDMRALEELKRLEEERVWQTGNQKEYHTRLTDILRTYIYERYDVNAPELTTDDLVGHSLVRTMPTTEREALERILRLADLVKFAKYSAIPDECSWAMGAAVVFVKATSTRKEVLDSDTNVVADGNVD